MKTIGIKLADGTFYPVLEEGTPKKRMLDLTTAKDNQTKVQIDLYRSENGTMEDAEYVDTLEVTKLNPHPNGEPELHLSVGLDEENNLTAEVVDPETGKKSETEVNLVSRTEAERAEPADFAITGNDDATIAEDSAAPAADESNGIIADDHASDSIEDATFSPDDLPDLGTTALEDMPFSFDHSEPNAAGNPASSSTQEKFEGELPDFAELDDIPVEDTTLESVDFNANDKTTSNDFIGTESPDLTTDATSSSDDTVQTDTTTVADPSESVSDTVDNFSTEDFSLPDLNDDFGSDSSDPFADTVSTESSSNEDTELPDFNDDFGSDTTIFADTPSSDNSTDTAEPEGFDLPDFDVPVTENNGISSDSNSGTTGLDFDDLDDPAFNSTSDDDLFGTSTSSSSSSGSGSAMDFSDLYDKETIAGEHASLYDEEEEGKKTRTPVVICIICAIICVIATVLLLFVVPSKYNLLASRNTNGVSLLDKFFHKESAVEKTVEEPKEEPKFVDVVVEDPKDEAAPEAVEDKIIIAPEPEKVVPKPVPVEEKKPEIKNTSDVKYHIRWGDTLWDISESYYKTPWKYPKIADYNKIKNPDLIISGTDILIPAE
jgi:LysM repeat protein